MKFTKYLKNLFTSLGAFVALGAVSCGFIFALALIVRCFIRAWHAGWTLLAVLIIGCSVTLLPAAPLGTPIYFPQIGTTGAANSRDIMVIPDPSPVPLIYASNLVAFQTLLLHPVRGGTTNYLLPWGYTIRVDGIPRTSHIVVPISTNVINVVSLITNALAIGYPISSGGSTTGFTGSITNFSGSGLGVNYEVLIVDGAGFTNASFTLTNGGYVYDLPGGSEGTHYVITQNGPLWNLDSDTALLYQVTNSAPVGAWVINPAGAGSANGVTSRFLVETNAATQFNVTVYSNGVCVTNFGPDWVEPPAPLAATPVISLTAPADGNTNWFGPWTPGTVTAGFQEAINTLPVGNNLDLPGGGKIEVRPGVYPIGRTICTPTNNAPFSLTLAGVGMSASILLLTNPVPMDLLKVDARGSTNGYCFFARDLGFLSVTNACTNLLELQGVLLNASPYYEGNIARAQINHCWFGWWGGVTNNTQGLTPDQPSRNVPHNLCPIYYNNNYGDELDISYNSFTHVNSLFLANDHVSFHHNMLEAAGSPQANAWPASSPFARGYGVIFGDPVNAGTLHNNGNRVCWISHNTWVCRGDVNHGGGYLFNEQPFTPYTPHTIYGDSFNELDGPAVATTWNKIELLSCTFNGNVANRYCNVTNLADFTAAFQVDTGLVHTVASFYESAGGIRADTNLIVGGYATLTAFYAAPAAGTAPKLWNSNNTTMWILYTNGTSSKLP